MQDNDGNSLPVEELLSIRPEEVSFPSVAATFTSRDVGTEDRSTRMGTPRSRRQHGLHNALKSAIPPWWQWRHDWLMAVSIEVSQDALRTDNQDTIIEITRERGIQALKEDILKYGWHGEPPAIRDQQIWPARVADPLAQTETFVFKSYLPNHIWFSTSHQYDNKPLALPEAALVPERVQSCTCATCYHMTPYIFHSPLFQEDTPEWIERGIENGWLDQNYEPEPDLWDEDD